MHLCNIICIRLHFTINCTTIEELWYAYLEESESPTNMSRNMASPRCSLYTFFCAKNDDKLKEKMYNATSSRTKNKRKMVAYSSKLSRRRWHFSMNQVFPFIDYKLNIIRAFQWSIVGTSRNCGKICHIIKKLAPKLNIIIILINLLFFSYN